jgi:Flp pilus assembly protein TadD
MSLAGRFSCCFPSLAVQGQSTVRAANPQKLFATGETALRENKLDEAERDFRAVLAVDPGVAGAYANLGVIHMRRKQWPQALAMLLKAEKLAPTVAGIRLNIGLVYFRQNDFLSAIKVSRRAPPRTHQARYLLGLCYSSMNGGRYDYDAEPLWGSNQVNYLYVKGGTESKQCAA